MPRAQPHPPIASVAAKALTRVLDKSELIKDVVEECAEELASVNAALKKELGNHPSRPGMENALHQSESIESKVQSCAEDLASVNLALEDEVRERHLLEDQMRIMKSEAEASLYQALHDPLTSQPNRVLFNDRLEHGLVQARRHGWTLAVMFIDLDKFKEINDTYGHEVGDKVLQTIADRLQKPKRDGDAVSRHGGDEFLYLLHELADAADASLVAKKIVRVAEESCEISVDGVATSHSIKLSIGIAIFPRDGETADALVQAADKAMYVAKKSNLSYAFAD